MLHLVPDFASQPRPEPYAEAVSRLASIRHALRLVDDHGGGPAPDLDWDSEIAAAWDEAGPATQRKAIPESLVADVAGVPGDAFATGEISGQAKLTDKDGDLIDTQGSPPFAVAKTRG